MSAAETAPPVVPAGGITEAILRTQAEVTKLDKGAFNAHGKYKFVSIDDYYEKVASVANTHGLTWLASCTGVTVIGEKSVRFDYVFALYHVSGEVQEGAFRHPVIHPIQGAQTAGSAMSYVDKLFMRHCFHVATGELDADSTAPEDTGWAGRQPQAGGDGFPAAPTRGTPPPEAIREVVAGLRGDKPVINVPNSETGPAQLDLIEDIFLRFGGNCRTETELMDFWHDNIAALDALQTLDPRRHTRVRNSFTDRKEAILKTES